MGVDPDVFVPGLSIRGAACGKWHVVTKVVPDTSGHGTSAALMSGVDGLSPEEQERLWRERPEFME